MFQETNHNFRVHRRIPLGLSSNLLSSFSGLDMADIVGLVNARLKTIVQGSTIRTNFSLIGVFSDNNGFGYLRFNHDIPVAKLKFVFALDNISGLDSDPVVKVKTRLIKFRTYLSVLIGKSGRKYRILTLGFSSLELGTSSKLRGTLQELKLLYYVVGANSKAVKLNKARSYNKLESYRQFLEVNPRVMVANYSPEFWAFNKHLWLRFPNFIPELGEFETLFYFRFIHKDRLRSSGSTLSAVGLSKNQKARVGSLLRPGDNGNTLVNTVYRSMLEVLQDTHGSDFNSSRSTINRVKPSFLALAGYNFADQSNSGLNYDVVRSLALEIASGDTETSKSKLFNLIWNQ